MTPLQKGLSYSSVRQTSQKPGFFEDLLARPIIDPGQAIKRIVGVGGHACAVAYCYTLADFVVVKGHVWVASE